MPVIPAMGDSTDVLGKSMRSYLKKNKKRKTKGKRAKDAVQVLQLLA
jgi:hypothetical protein